MARAIAAGGDKNLVEGRQNDDTQDGCSFVHKRNERGPQRAARKKVDCAVDGVEHPVGVFIEHQRLWDSVIEPMLMG